MSRTVFLAYLCVPLMAITPEHCHAMRPVRDAGPRRSLELPQLCICNDGPEDVETQETAEDCHDLDR